MILLVTYTAKPHCREAFLRAVQENSLQEIVRQEDGCLEYAYYAAVADAEKILLVEKWASEEQQQTHLRQPHMQHPFVRLHHLPGILIDNLP